MNSSVMIIIMLFGFIIASIEFSILVLYKKQIKDLKKQMEFMTINTTNIKVSTWLTFKSINEFAESLNAILKQYKDYEHENRKINASLKETITSISHDIRTPLTSATGYIQMLRSSSITPKQKDEYIEIIEKRIFSVKKMLDQLFEFVRIEANELVLRYEKININNILRDTMSEFYDDFIKKGYEPNISISEEVFEIYGDKDALKRVFQNIIENAIFHGDVDFCVKTMIYNEVYKIECKNHTHTIRKEDIDLLFNRFYTTDKSRTKKTTGLGLSIAKKLVSTMNGNIYAYYENDCFGIIIEFKIKEQKILE